MLQELKVMIYAAERVTGRREGGTKFGHLIILLRDVDGRAAEIEELLFGVEDTDHVPLDQQKAPSERNSIRRAVKFAFESIVVHTMPSPHPRIAGMRFLAHLLDTLNQAAFVHQTTSSYT